MARLDAFLQLGREQGCSDIHFAVGTPPILRLSGELMPVKYRDLTADELEDLVGEILNEQQREQFISGEDVDFSYCPGELGRFRANLFRKVGGIGATFRVIANDIPEIENLDVPPAVKGLTTHKQGLVLVTGATGMGKSTTLAAMINHLNSTKRLSIITLEDPVEFVHPSKMSLVIQREVGTQVKSFADGLRAALREDPDVILVGELRDAETISLAMAAAETGHLVFGTLHTTSAIKTLDRLIDALPADQRAAGTSILANNLRGVVSQVLVRKANSRSRKVIAEIMIMTDAIANLMLNDRVFQISSSLQTGREQGMQLMDQALLEALQKNELDPDDAYRHAVDKKQFQRFVTDPQVLPKVKLVGS